MVRRSILFLGEEAFHLVSGGDIFCGRMVLGNRSQDLGRNFFGWFRAVKFLVGVGAVSGWMVAVSPTPTPNIPDLARPEPAPTCLRQDLQEAFSCPFNCHTLMDCS